MLPEALDNLLQQAGHRPPKHGAKWTCATCPPGKSPALKVDGEVYFCHRCQVGGNIITLRRELGLENVRPRRTPEQLRLRRFARVLASLVKQWEKSQRRWLIVQFRNATDRGMAARDRGQELLQRGCEVPAEIIDEAFQAACERDGYTQWLDQFDRLTAGELVAEYMAFRAAIDSDVEATSTQEIRNAI